MRQGCLGLRSASRDAKAAYWVSWADTLPMVCERNSAVAEHVEHARTQEVHHELCLAELHNACGRLDREGFWWRPTWSELRHGKRPSESVSSEPGEKNRSMGSQRVGSPKFCAFFPLWVSSRGILVFEAPDSYDSPPNVDILGPQLSKTPPKFHEKNREKEERMKIVAGEERKERNFGRSDGGGSGVGWGGSKPTTQHNTHNTHNTHENKNAHNTHNTTQHNTTQHTNGLAKNGLAKIELSKVGHNRPELHLTLRVGKLSLNCLFAFRNII